ncbi:MAG: ATP-binding cassette domain-containing protein [Clostridia bacterium]|nr:ATP-binding cassette domain-containing protein [Clostridia bacterium]
MIIENLNVAFKDNVVYKDFSINFDNNKVTCILGPSGCGKTTLLNVLTNNVKYSGNVSEIGKCAYVFQNSRLIESISVKKNLEFVIDKSKYYLIDKVLEELQILDCKDKLPTQLSGGQASRVAIARAIIYDPQIILMDEPFKDLDIVLSKTLIDLFRNLIKQNNLGAVYVTHNVDEALSIADRVIVLKSNPAKVALDIEINSSHTNLASKELNEAREKIYSALA